MSPDDRGRAASAGRLFPPLAGIALLLSLLVPETSLAITFCLSVYGGDSCQGIEPVRNTPGLSLSLYLKTGSTSAFGMGGQLMSLGDSTFTSFSTGASPPPGGCSLGPISAGSAPVSTAFEWTCGDGSAMPAGNSYHFVTIGFDSGGDGDDVILTRGTYLTSLAGAANVDNVGQTLAIFLVPEPSVAGLLGVGLAALACLRRRSIVR